jgi:2-isopropylmalate synthase
LENAPIWLSTDLRDGNQALFEPMSVERKLRFFQLLCGIGFKQIEVGFPAASQTEFDFVRRLIEEGHIPADVSIGVLTQTREHLIARTIEALQGAPSAIVHLYNATSKPFRELVFGLREQEVIALAQRGVQQVRELTAASPTTQWQLEYSPEAFSATELGFAKQICDAVSEAWGATPERKLILNLPATVEVAMPNIYADQIEWMHEHLARRDSIVLSVHPHNDRGCAVAAAELAQLAGAERVEGCLFGNGERTGNVDLVTLALNLYTQGVDPGLDFSDIDAVARTVEYCTGLPIHPRHPYVGDLVYTAFSGSHQDAIRKGMAAQRIDAPWEVPYLPIDPKDLGRNYDSIIRINSQSGKGGIAYLLEQDHGLVMPRRLQVEFSSVVQRHADGAGTEISSSQLWQLLSEEYLQRCDPLQLLEHHLFECGEQTGVGLRLMIEGTEVGLQAQGNGPLDAAMAALGLPVTLHSYEERAIGSGAGARAVAFIELRAETQPLARFGIGIHPNIVTASILALCSGFNRLLAALPPAQRAQALAQFRRSGAPPVLQQRRA